MNRVLLLSIMRGELRRFLLSVRILPMAMLKPCNRCLYGYWHSSEHFKML